MAAHLGLAVPGDPIPPRKRLDSWKEIATFFGRDERTVKRWEKERGLPVYRVPGSARGGVFAYADELTEWLERPTAAIETEKAAALAPEVLPVAAPAAAVHPVEERRRAGDLPLAAPEVAKVPSPEQVPFAGAGHGTAVASARTFLWLLPLALIAISFLAISFTHRDPRFRQALAAPHVPAAEAQDLYLKGRYYFEKRTADDLSKAVDFFTQAIVHDPAYAAPYVGLADTYNLLQEYSAMSPAEAFPRARAAAAKAVELDPNSAEAHNSLAFATFWGSFGAASAEQEFKRAIELDPNLPRAHHWYATFLNQTNRPQEALSEIERARQLDPSSTPILADKGFILAQAGKVEEAKALLMQIAQSRPDFVHPHQYLASIYFQEGDYEAYFAEFKMAAKLRHDQKLEQAVENEQSAYAFGGLPVMLKQRLDMAQQSFREGRGAAFDVADAYAALGEYDDAMKYLKIASQRREFPLITVTLNANFRPLQGNPEFREIVAKIGLPPIR